MVLAPSRFVDDPAIGPAQSADAHCQGDTGQPCSRRGSASLTNRYLVFNVERERLNLFFFGLQHLTICGKNEVVFDLRTSFTIASARNNGEFICGLGPDFK